MRTMRGSLGVVLLLSAMACTRSGETTDPAAAGAAGASTVGAPERHPEIDAPRMFEALEWLSNDAQGGRYTLSEDIDRAATWLADHYESMGLRKVGETFPVLYDLPTGTEPGPDLNFWIEREGQAVEVGADAFVSTANGHGTPAYGEVVVAGKRTPKGIKGKLALIQADQLVVDKLETRAAKLVDAGAIGIVIVLPERPEHAVPLDITVATVLLTDTEAAERLPMAQAKPGKALPDLRISLAAKPVDVTQPAHNVLAWIPGSEHPEELVILGAHYDHIGTDGNGIFCGASPGGDPDDKICNGADDNASGTAMVLEIAQAVADAGFTPTRTLVFAHFSGEEMGLLGSRALANEPPDVAPFDGGEVVAMINLDMVGRYREDPGLMVGGVSSSDQWMPLLDATGSHGLTMTFERSVTGRSDHANFYRKKIPVLFFFTGLHSDYHRAGDHFDKINQDGMSTIAKMVLDLTVAVADGAKIEWSEPRSDTEGLVGRLPGSDPDTVERTGSKND